MATCRPSQSRLHAFKCPLALAERVSKPWTSSRLLQRHSSSKHKFANCVAANIRAQAIGMRAKEVQQMTSLPAQYKRLVAKHVGESFREVTKIQQCNLRLPQEDEVLVRIHFAGINAGCETFRARGEYAFAFHKGQTNFPVGAEAAGVVVALGPDVDSLEVGQAVTVKRGGFAEYATTGAANCFPVRAASAEAVAVALSGLTAAAALLYVGGLQSGETVLVTAAAGGTGHFGVQIAKLKGCRVIATCGSAEKAERLRDMGADRVINYRKEDVEAVLREEFPGQIDIAYEGVGGPLRDAVLANLSPAGRLLAVGYISGYPHNRPSSQDQSANDATSTGASDNGNQSSSAYGVTSHTWDLLPEDKVMWKGLTLHNGGQTLYGSVWPQERQKTADALKWIFDQYHAGKISAWVDPKPFRGLDSVADAVDHMLSGESIGKVVVDLR